MTYPTSETESAHRVSKDEVSTPFSAGKSEKKRTALGVVAFPRSRDDVVGVGRQGCVR